MRIALALILLLLKSSIIAQHFDWVEKIGYNGGGNDYGHDIFEDKQGNIYATGLIKNDSEAGTGVNTVFLNAYGAHDVYFAKYKEDGTLMWAKRFGTGLTEFGHRIGMDSLENVYLSGEYENNLSFDNNSLTNYGAQNNVFLGQFDTSGADNWLIGFGASGGMNIQDAYTAANGTTYITGQFSGTAILGDDTLLSSGNTDVFITSINNQGNFIWSKRFGYTQRDEGRSLELNSEGNLVATGIFTSQITFNGNVLNGYTGLDVWVVLFDTIGGVPLWSHSIGSTGNVFGRGMSLDAQDNIYISGNFNGVLSFSNSTNTLTSNSFVDMYCVRIDENGQLDWANVYGGALSAEQPFSMDTKADGTSAVAFLSTDTTIIGNDTIPLIGIGNRDWVIVELDSSGSVNWTLAVGGYPYAGKDPSFQRLKYSSCGSVLVTGGFLNTVQFFPDSLSAAGTAADVFIARVIPKMKLDSSNTFNICTGSDLLWIYQDTCLLDSIWINLYGDDTVSFVGNIVNMDSAQSNYDVEIIGFDGYYYDTLYISDLVSVIGQPAIDVLEDTIICVGDSVEFALGVYSSYLWSTGDTTNSIFISDSGHIDVEVTDSNGCISRDTAYISIKICTNVNDFEDDNLINLYPNPAADIVYIINNGHFPIKKVEIFTMEGKQCKSYIGNKNRVYLDDFPPGIYLVRVVYGNDVIYNNRLIKN